MEIALLKINAVFVDHTLYFHCLLEILAYAYIFLKTLQKEIETKAFVEIEGEKKI